MTRGTPEAEYGRDGRCEDRVSTSSANDPPRVAAVIVSHNRGDLLPDRLDALVAQTTVVDHIIVVDNASDDGSPDIVRERYPDITLFAMAENLGAAGGFAHGAAAALEFGPDALWLFNDNDRAEPHALATLLARLTRDPLGHTMVGSTAIAGDGLRRLGASWRHGLVDPPPLVDGADEYAVDVTTFNGLLVPADAFRDVGFPRAEFFMMWEEYEWCLRARDAGWRIVILEEPLVDIRSGEAPMMRYPPWRGYYQARNALVTVRERHKARELAWYVSRELKFLIAAVSLAAPRQRIGLRLRGVADGLRGRTGRLVEPDR
jgi:rhamnopyranosyl-N-acetylglucosaminyl-diphospho-decaprenol beta-1,3/1,4-galactofuranosyltransferase